MKLLILCLLVLGGCDGFDAMKFNEDNVKIDKVCKAAGLETVVSIRGNFLCRPKATAEPEGSQK